MDLSQVVEPTTWAFLEKLKKEGGKPLYTIPVSEGRAIFESIQKLDSDKPEVDIEDCSFPVGPHGSVSIRIVRPKGVREALPVIMYFHGAGWVFGSYETHGRLVRELAVGTRAALIFVNYRLSPEAQYPSAIEEVYAATKYVAEHGKELNVDSSRLAIAGDSVGGNMTAVVAILAKERKGPKINYQVLFYPVTDANFETGSYKEFAEGPWLTKKAMEWFWSNYLPDVKKRKEYMASPLQATVEQLKGLPPALVINGECDVLRDEGEAYARKLNQAGVQVTGIRQHGTIHDFALINAISNAPAARNAIETAIAHLCLALSEKKQ